MSQVLSEKVTVRQLRARPLGFRNLAEMSAETLGSQFLPDAEAEQYMFEWRTLIQERTSMLQRSLEESYSTIRFTE
jgi:hypothetical protein